MNEASSYPDPFNVVWTDPGPDSSASMPLGSGDVGLNVWVEAGGDLLFYIGKADAWSGQNQLLKLGRVRLSLAPNPYRQGLPFRQTLRLRQGDIEVQAGEPDSTILTRIRADVILPVVFLEVESRKPVEVRVSLEMWRETASLSGEDPNVALPAGSEDAVVPGKDRILWFHRNRTSIYPASMRLQGLGSLLSGLPDTLIHRTFGGMIRGEGFVGETPYSLKSVQPGKRFILAVHLLTMQTDTAQEWADRLEKQAERVEAVPAGKARNAHNRWWGDFWKRSRIGVSGPEPEIETLNRGYALQRFISACAGRGAYPIKFNGSLFTVDAREPGETGDADYRRWGGCYWFQNTRLAYWPMLASGDFDLMPPLFRMYRAMLPLARERTRLYFGHSGTFFPETLAFWGLYADDNYGMEREGKPVSHVDNTYIRHYHSGALELLAILLDYYAHTRDAEFIRETILPLAGGILDFYDKHYPRADGKLRFEPAQALETWQEAVNPLPEIAGLKWVLDGLLNLPPAQTGADRRAAWKRLLSELPPLPAGRENGQPFLKAASDILAPAMNSENPELYAVFPYRLYGVGKPEIAAAVETFRRRIYQGNEGWRQDPIQAALLGLAEPARQMVLQRFSTKHPGSRFPAFWGPNADWIPDQDHGTVGLMALQTMLLQAEGRKILLFPAWPENWDVSFRLHAPYKTTVEGVCRRGKLESLQVTPASRRKDVVLGSGIETEKPL
ncbi:MAG: hypothetical protein IT210_14630 [Armatimonadetes bacterium]|nr:hypothetical protein [Armatimonadota bacterium]